MRDALISVRYVSFKAPLEMNRDARTFSAAKYKIDEEVKAIAMGHSTSQKCTKRRREGGIFCFRVSQPIGRGML